MTIQGVVPIRNLLRMEQKAALPKRKGKRIPLPLCCWLQCSKPIEGSRIRGLRESERVPRWGWDSYSAGTYHIAGRIAKKWGITHLQYQILVRYLAGFYDGRVNEPMNFAACGLHGDDWHTPESNFARARLVSFNSEVFDMIRNHGTPLRALISKEITALILITQTRTIL